MCTKSVSIIVAIGVFLTSLPALANSRYQGSAGDLELKQANGQRAQALLLDTAISGRITGMIASINVRQTFRNQSSDWVNGRYVFPLPSGAAVDSLRIQIGERIIDGIVKEKAAAKKIFENAKRVGKKAGLLEQHRPNLFSIAVVNIGPNEEVIADITFVNTVRYQNNTFSLSLPTTLTPRYVPGAPINLATLNQGINEELTSQLRSQENVQVNPATGWAANTPSVPDAADITPPQVHSVADQTSHNFSLSLSLDAGLDLQSVESQTHEINTDFTGKNQVNISLVNGHAPMNADLVLSWQPLLGHQPKAALFQQQFNNAYYSLLMLTPPDVNTTVSLPRDITFIVDSSGSMAGGSMAQAKRALNDGLSYLSAGDRFNVIDFDSSFRPLFKQSQPATQEHLTNASRMINNLHADGGTEMMGALRHALHTEQDSAYLRQIVFITDGAIGNEKELFELINKQLGDTRLFTVGIGSAPNAYFMQKAAKFGRGTYTTIRDVNQVNTKIAELFKKITRPVLRNIEIIWPNEVEQYPTRVPDLYAGEPLTLFVKSDKPIDKVTALGEMLNTPWQQSLSLGNSPTKSTHSQDTAKNLDTVWARQKVANLMDKFVTNELSRETVKPLIVDLGINHNIVTKFTSLVAVEQTPSRPAHEKAKHKNVPNLIPKGNTMPAPQTATPAALLTLLGGLMILLGGLLSRRTRTSKWV